MLLTYGLRSLWARRTTTLATATGISLLVFVLAASGMLASGMRETMASAGRSDYALVLQQNQWSEQGSHLPQSVLGQVASAPGLRRDAATGQPLLAGETVSHLVLATARDAERFSTLQIRGVTGNVFALRPSVRLSAGRAIVPGTAEAIVGRGVADRFEGLSIGGSFELAAGRPIAVVGVFESGGSAYESEIWADFDTARSSLAMESVVSSITAQLESEAALDGFAALLTQDKQTGLAVERESGYYARISGGAADVIATLGLAEAGIFSLGAIFGTMIVFYASVTQRRHEIGVLRALGFRRRSILATLLAEAVALSLAGGALGIALSLCTPWLDFNMINFATDQEVAFHFKPDARALLLSLGLASIVGLLGGALPALRAARLQPVQALRS
jgi:putative ABC transport system permease protein